MPSPVSTVLIALGFFVGGGVGLTLLIVALAVELLLFVLAGLDAS